MSLIRNPKNKFGEMLFNIATTVILPEIIGKVSNTILDNVTAPRKEERVYTQQPEKIIRPIVQPEYSIPRVRERENREDTNVNINLNIITNDPIKVEPCKQYSEPKRNNEYRINPNIYIPMYIDYTGDI